MEDNRLRLGARKLTSSTFNVRDSATTNDGASDRKQKAAEYNQYPYLQFLLEANWQ